MAKAKNLLGISYFGLGPVGDGVMGTAITEFKDIEDGSLSVQGSTSSEETISTESDFAYLTVNGKSEPHKITIRLYGISTDEMVMLMGGVSNGGEWEAPIKTPNIYLSMLIVGTEIDGVTRNLKIPYGKISASYNGNITKAGLPATEVTITANTPVSAAGVEGAPFIIGDNQ